LSIELKAERLVSEGRVTYYGDGLFVVRGDSDTREVRFNKVLGIVESCDCRWFVLRHQKCSHMLAVEMFIDKNGLEVVK